MSNFASVVGMVVSVQRRKGQTKNALSKLFYCCPDEKECEASFDAKMLMLDG